MKKTLLILLINMISAVSSAQADYSGNYSYQMKVYVDKNSELKPTKEEKEQGRMGELTLFKIDNNKYKFWISANRGWPSYNEGNINGIIEIINNKAVFKKKLEYADSACSISFSFYPKYIAVKQSSEYIECGFGMNVYTDGKYNKKNSYKLKNADLENQYYIEPDKYKVTVEKAFLFEHETGRTIKKQYFINGDIILGIEEKNDFIYVEHISSNGKFVYGWLKKSEVKIVEKAF